MNAPKSDRTPSPQLTHRQQQVEAFLRSHRPLAPSWSEDDVATVRQQRVRGVVRVTWPVVAAWLCGLAAGVLVTVGVQGTLSPESSSRPDRVVVRTNHESHAVVEHGDDSSSDPTSGDVSRDSSLTYTSRAGGVPGFSALTEGTLYAGAIRRMAPRPLDSEAVESFPTPAAVSDSSGIANLRPDAPLLTPSPACRRELLQRLGAVPGALFSE